MLCSLSSPWLRMGAQEPLPSPFPTHRVTWLLPPRLAVLGFLRPPKDSPHPHGGLWDHLQLTLAYACTFHPTLIFPFLQHPAAEGTSGKPARET